MTIDLSAVTLDGAFCETELPDGSVLVLTLVDEDIPSASGTAFSAPLKRVTLTHVGIDGEEKQLPCIVGMGEDGIAVWSDHAELLGSPLDGDNMAKCTIEIAEEA